MKNTIIVVVILAIVIIGGYFIFSNSYQTPINTSQTNTVPVTSDNTNANVPVSATTPAPTVATSTPVPNVVMATVDIKNFAFSPATLTVKVGTRVTWTNNDTVSHTVTSDTGSLLSSPTIAPGQTFSFTFNNVGTTNYHCAIHPMMKGKVIVTN